MRKMFLTIGGLLLLVGSHTPGWAGKEINLVVGSAQVVNVTTPQRVAIANPEIADLKQISDTELLISGKAMGSTTLIIWQASGEKDISTIVVTSKKSEQTMIQVDVQVMEITHLGDNAVGLNWEAILGGQLTLKESDGPLAAIGTLERGKLQLLLKLLREQGNAKVLARPKLLTLSGRRASFSSGGEIPVATTNSTGQSNIEWKKYGVNLDILPIAGVTKAVDIELRAEVSEVDYSHLVQNNPSIKTRWASTVIHVQPETTVVIGGLIQERNHVNEKGIPILMDIPVLGYLFKENRVVHEESELVIFVTPHIIGG